MPKPDKTLTTQEEETNDDTKSQSEPERLFGRAKVQVSFLSFLIDCFIRMKLCPSFHFHY
jgi:hypothetical protein